MEDRAMQFEDLEAWQLARRLVLHVYRLTGSAGLNHDFGLKAQIQRAAVSVMSNLAEGFERRSINEKRQFYSIARASCGETRSLLYLIEDLFPALPTAAAEARSQCITIGKLISGLIKSTENRQP